MLYPKGHYKARIKSLSLFLETLHQGKLFTEFELVIKDQCDGGHLKPSHVKSKGRLHSLFC